MRIDNVNIHFHPHQGAMVSAALAALLRPSADVKTETDAAATAPVEVPAIGDPWPGVKGIYAGVSRGTDGAPDAHLVLLTDKAPTKLAWQAAKDWAAGLGDGAHLPTRDESALLYAHLREEFQSDWHWTSTQYSESNAWIQYFGYGNQSLNDKKYERLARAVRRFPA